MLRAAGMGSDCSGTLTYSWAASEGTVSGTGPNAQFDSSLGLLQRRPQPSAIQAGDRDCHGDR